MSMTLTPSSSVIINKNELEGIEKWKVDAVPVHEIDAENLKKQVEAVHAQAINSLRADGIQVKKLETLKDIQQLKTQNSIINEVLGKIQKLKQENNGMTNVAYQVEVKNQEWVNGEKVVDEHKIIADNKGNEKVLMEGNKIGYVDVSRPAQDAVVVTQPAQDAVDQAADVAVQPAQDAVVVTQPAYVTPTTLLYNQTPKTISPISQTINTSPSSPTQSIYQPTPNLTKQQIEIKSPIINPSNPNVPEIPAVPVTPIMPGTPSTPTQTPYIPPNIATAAKAHCLPPVTYQIRRRSA